MTSCQQSLSESLSVDFIRSKLHTDRRGQPRSQLPCIHSTHRPCLKSGLHLRLFLPPATARIGWRSEAFMDDHLRMPSRSAFARILTARLDKTARPRSTPVLVLPRKPHGVLQRRVTSQESHASSEHLRALVWSCSSARASGSMLVRLAR